MELLKRYVRNIRFVVCLMRCLNNFVSVNVSLFNLVMVVFCFSEIAITLGTITLSLCSTLIV